MDDYTGPWEIIFKLKGSSYEIKHRDKGIVSKRYAAHLSPFPDQLLPFMPVDGPDNRIDQIHTPIQKNPYKNAGLKGFAPSQPSKAFVANPAIPTEVDIEFPTLAELNAECFQWDEGEEDLMMADDSLCKEIEVFAVTRFQAEAAKRPPPPPIEAHPAPRVPDVTRLTASIMSSTDKLFFIAHEIIYLQLSIDAHPECLQGGRFLTQLCICHPADKKYNAINQRYWLDYLPTYAGDNIRRNRNTNLIKPSSNSESYAEAKCLRPFSQ